MTEPLDLTPIKWRLENATPGPWHSCPDDGCKCTMVMCSDYPVAEVTKGKWGDEFPSLRFAEGGEGSVTPSKVEAYMEQITYGEVDEKEALANRAFIREAPTDISNLIAEVERLRAALAQSR